MEFFKNCCKNLTQKNVKEQDTQVIKIKMPSKERPAAAEEMLSEGKNKAPEDYISSKVFPGGRVVPFVLPTLKASYVQPREPYSPRLQSGMQSSARCAYAERKAELLGTSYFGYNPEAMFHQDHTSAYISPGSSRRDSLKNRKSGPQSQEWFMGSSSQQRLSSSMFDLSSPQGQMQRFDSTCSTFSSASSMMSSMESSLDSVALSGDEQGLGKVCVRLNYQENLEQVWITLVQCSDLNLQVEGAEKLKIGFKGVITIPKLIQFKSSVKEFFQDVSFMETFVFSLSLQQLRCSTLVLRLQTQSSRKRTVAECVLPLRKLGPQESEHWLELKPPSKSSLSHSELCLSTCFQPVNGRIQLRVLKAQNLPPSSSPLSQTFFIKAEMHQLGQVTLTKKTRALKVSERQCQWEETFHFPMVSLEQPCSLTVRLYCRSSVRRKTCLGQVQLGFDSSVSEAMKQWKDTMALPEKVVTAWHSLSPP